MNRTPVSSDNISSIGYDLNSKTLEIQFNDGSIYQYYDVPDYVNRGLMGASSHGTYFHQHIKGKYRYKKIS